MSLLTDIDPIHGQQRVARTIRLPTREEPRGALNSSPQATVQCRTGMLLWHVADSVPNTSTPIERILIAIHLSEQRRSTPGSTIVAQRHPLEACMQDKVMREVVVETRRESREQVILC